MKTVEQWLQELPAGEIRNKALANMWPENSGDQAHSLVNALCNAFNWIRSPEGYRYWFKVDLMLKEQSE